MTNNPVVVSFGVETAAASFVEYIGPRYNSLVCPEAVLYMAVEGGWEWPYLAKNGPVVSKCDLESTVA